MKAKYQMTDYVFTGNPVVLESTSGYGTDGLNGGRFTVKYEGRRVYDGRFYAPLDIDVSEILASVGEWYREPMESVEDFIELIEADGTSSRKAVIEVDYDGQNMETFEMKALPGGIPGDQYRMYAVSGTDVFHSRLTNQGCNFFMTSRTAGWRIEMKETELYPLYFLSTGNLYRFREPGGLAIGLNVAKGLNVLDLAKLRKKFILHYGRLPSMIDVETEDGTLCCRIVITHCEPSKERYRLKFRNSFGVFEVMEITGKLKENMTFEDGEDSGYRRLDPITHQFSDFRERLEGRRVLEITTPVARSHRNLLADMIGSEEIYLLDAFRRSVRVNVTAEDLNLAMVKEEPESVTLRMELTESDKFQGEILFTGSDSRKPRVHGKEFDNKFN